MLIATLSDLTYPCRQCLASCMPTGDIEAYTEGTVAIFIII